MDAARFQAAVSEWKRALGDENVLTDASVLSRYAANVGGLKRTIPAVLRPGSAQDVQQIVAIANRHKAPVYPISCGKNWGLGSRVPAQDGTTVVDLGRMNRIREVNVPHHYAVVEPGVTQRQMYDYLVANNLPLVLNVTGSAADTSLVGNALERGIGYFSSRADSLTALEVVLGNGTVVRTGFGHFGGVKTAHLYRHGIGPSLDGLFAQSNFGIVTSAGIDLIPQRDAQMVMISRIDRPEKLGAFVDALADLRRREVIQTVFHVGNRHRTQIALAPLVARQLMRAAPGAAPHELHRQAEALVEGEGFGAWSAVGGIMGTAGQLGDARAEIRRTLGGVARTIFLNDFMIGAAKRLAKVFRFSPFVRRKETLLLGVEPLYNLAKGVPSDAAMNSVWWPLNDMPHAESDNPDASRCGMLYCVPMLPADGAVAQEAMEQTGRVFRKYNFTPFVTLNLVDARSLEAVINMAFDRDQPAQIAAAHACNDELTEWFLREGYPPYRVGPQSMGLIVDERDGFWQTVRELKKALDPNGIISPGRYGPA